VRRNTTLQVMVAVLVLVTATTARAGDIMIYTWDQELSGSAHGRDSGTNARASGTLRDDDNRETGFRFYTKLFGKKFEIGYFTMDNVTTIDADVNFSFEGTDFDVSQDIFFQMDAKVFEFFPRFNLFNKDGSSLDFIFGVKVFDLSAKVTGTDLLAATVQEELDETVPVPQVGLHVRVGELKKGLRFEGTFKTLDLEVSGVDVKMTDLQAFMAYRTGQDFDVVLGYRKISNRFIKDEGTADEAGVDIDNAGLFIGGKFNF